MPPEAQAPQDGRAATLPNDAAGWTFRGRSFSSGEFNTAMVHFYRGELSRSTSWRNRLDTTTNWAVVTTGAAVSFAFSDPNHHHGVILLNTLLVAIFLFIEARRYRYYELWSYRVRLMETDFFAAMLVPPFCPSKDWADCVAASLLHPEFPISLWEALGRRYRRNYFWIFLLLATSWVLKTAAFPQQAASWAEIVNRARIGPIEGQTVLLIGFLFNGLFMALGLFTIGLQQASGEVLPRPAALPNLGLMLRQVQNNAEKLRELLPRHAIEAQPLLVYVITCKGLEISSRLTEQLKISVSSLRNTGTYSGQEREALLCPCAPHNLDALKQFVRQIDPEAFVIVNSAQEMVSPSFGPRGEWPKL